MCQSLKDGGLRCESHLSADIASINNEYAKGLEKQADKAGVALDSRVVSNILEKQKNKIADAKGELLSAQALAVEAKAELENHAVKNEYANYVSIRDDLANMKSETRSHFYPWGKNDTKMVIMIERLQKSGIADFARGKEYIEAVHLSNLCEKQLENFRPQDTPEAVAKFKALQEEKNSIDSRLDSIRNDFEKSHRTFSPEFVEEAIIKMPPPNDLSQLRYKSRVEAFHKAKQSYMEESNKFPSDPKALRSFVKEQNGGHTPFDNAAKANYMLDVYDKTDKAIALKSRLKAKKAQIELTPGYRKRLTNAAKIKAEEGDNITAAKMLRKKEMLDIKADITMLQNRMRVPVNS